MTVRVTWMASEGSIASYALQRSVAPGGPWTNIASVPHAIPGANWDDDESAFFYLDTNGAGGLWYRVTAIDTQNIASAPSAPFLSGAPLPAPPLVNSFSIVVGNVGALLHLGYTTIEVWESTDSSATWTEITNANTRLTLLDGVALYPFYHSAGKTYSRYKWRFSANGVAPLSNFSAYVLGKPSALLDPSALAVGVAQFVGIDGKPLKRRVVISVESPPSKLGSYTTGDDTPYIVDTDETGFLQVPLVRGLAVRMAVEGTAIVRQFTVPNSASFDLFAVGSEIPDRFTVQSAPAKLTRRSLS